MLRITNGFGIFDQPSRPFNGQYLNIVQALSYVHAIPSAFDRMWYSPRHQLAVPPPVKWLSHRRRRLTRRGGYAGSPFGRRITTSPLKNPSLAEESHVCVRHLLHLHAGVRVYGCVWYAAYTSARLMREENDPFGYPHSRLSLHTMNIKAPLGLHLHNHLEYMGFLEIRPCTYNDNQYIHLCTHSWS